MNATAVSTPDTMNEPLWTPSFALLCMAMMFFFASNHMVTPLVPLLLQRDELIGHMGMIVAAFMLTSLIIRPWVGKWSDEVNPKLLMLVGLGFFSICPFIYVLLKSETIFYVVRILHGASFALFYTASGTYLTRIIPTGRNAEGISHYSNAIKIAMAFSPALALFLTERHLLTQAFWLSGTMSILGMLCILCLKSQPSVSNSKKSLSKLINKKAFFPGIIMATNSLAFGALIPFIPMLALEKQMAHPGWFYTGYAIFLIASRGLTGNLSDKYGRQSVLIPGLFIVPITLFILSWASGEWPFIIAACLYGLAAGVVQPSLMALAVDNTLPEERGSAVATFTMLCDAGIALGSLLVGTLGPTQGYTHMILWIGILAFIGFVGYNVSMNRSFTRLNNKEVFNG
jgi:MFS family permease